MSSESEEPEQVERVVDVVLVKSPSLSFGDPSPLGFLGFGLALFMFGGTQLQMYWPDALVMSSMFFLGGFMQICAGFMHYVKDNLFGMVFHMSFGSLFAWMVIQQLLSTLGVDKVDPKSTGVYLSIFLVHGFFLLLISVRFKIFHILQFIFLLAEVWLGLTIASGVVKEIDTGEYQETFHEGFTFAAGVTAIILSLMSIYYVGAMIVNEKYERMIMPFAYDVCGGKIVKKVGKKLPRKKKAREQKMLQPRQQKIMDKSIESDTDDMDLGESTADEYTDGTDDGTDDEGYTDDEGLIDSDTEEDTGDETS